MKRRIEEVKKIVIKVGSSSLCDKDGKINKEKILMLTWQIAKLKREGYIVVLVSSGAIAAGMGALGLPGDLSSASRFVRVAFTNMNATKGLNEKENVNTSKKLIYIYTKSNKRSEEKIL